MNGCARRFVLGFWALACAWLASSCATVVERPMTVTAYCGCGECCNWKRQGGFFLSPEFYDKTIAQGPCKGRPYSGLTASGTKPREYNPGLVSCDSLLRPWMIPVRILLFPWLLLPHAGTAAADTGCYPFGTRMYVDGYGWCVVVDRGTAIRGPDRLDVFYCSHQKALEWGRQRIVVEIVQ